MNPREFVSAVLSDDVVARQLVKDAKREGYSWANAPAPDFVGPKERAVYAGVVELLAGRAGEKPPAWTGRVGAAPEPVYLMGATSKVWRREYLATAPEALKKHNVYASREYLDVL